MKTPKRFFLIIIPAVIVAVTAALPATAQTSPPANTSEETTNKVEIDPVAEDTDIDARLTRILTATGWFARPQIRVSEGIVFIDGEVDTNTHKIWAGNLARNTQDVVAVVNRLKVVPQPELDFTPALNEMTRLWRSFIQLLPLLLFGTVIMVLAWFGASLISQITRPWFETRTSSKLLGRLLARTVTIPILLIAAYFVLQTLGLTQLALTVMGGTGIIGIVAGFAFRDIAENFLASILLSVRRPFLIDDFVRIGEHEGIVRAMTTRSTQLMTLDGNLVHVPNAMVFKSVIINHTANPSSRATFSVSIGYEHSIVEAQAIVGEVVRTHIAVLDDPPPQVLVDELGSSSIHLRVLFWFNFREHASGKIASVLMRQSLRALEDAGIAAPDDAREIIFPDGVPLVRSELQDEKSNSEHTINQNRLTSFEKAKEDDSWVRSKKSKDDIDSSTDEDGLESDQQNIMEQSEMLRRDSDGTDLLTTQKETA